MMHFNKIAKASLLLLTMNVACFSSYCEGATVFPETPMGTPSSTEIAVAADDSDNAVAVFTNGNLIEARYSPGNQTWQPNVTISDNNVFKDSPDVAMDGSSTALAVWRASDGIETNRLVAGVWGTPEALEGPTADLLTPPFVAMNGSGGGVAAWSNLSLSEIHASFFTAGAWAPFEVIGTSGADTRVAYSTNGDAAVIWRDGSDIYTALSIGLTWQPFTVIDSTGGNIPDIGIDATGNAIAIWSGNNVADTLVSIWDGATWSAPQTISEASGNSSPQIAVAPNGTAVAIWTDATQDIQLSQFNGTSWTVPVIIGNNDSDPDPSISMDSTGNAIIAYVTNDEVFNRLLPLGGTLGDPVLVASEDEDIIVLDVALSSGSLMGVPAWGIVEFDVGFFTFATFVLFDLAPPPPVITGSVCKNSFAMQSDRVHIINITPSTDPTVVSYYIYRNGVLIGIVPATGPLTFYDHNRHKGSVDTYTVYAVTSGGVFSEPASITLD